MSSIFNWIRSIIFSAFTGYLLLVTAVVVTIIWLLYKLRIKMIEQIEYSRVFSEEGVHAGDTALLTEFISNPTFFPLFRIDVGCYVDTGLEIDGVIDETKEKLQYFTSRFNLMPFTKVTRTHEVKCLTRNHYILKTAEIICKKGSMTLDAPAELYVYPEPLSGNKQVLPQLNFLGNEMSRNRFIKDPFYIAGLRSYMPGDSFSSINFKASARSIRGGARELVVNNNDFSSQLNIMIYMDFNVPRFLKTATVDYERLIEVGLSYSAAIINEAISQGGKAGFATNSRGYDGSSSVHYSPAAGMVHMIEIYKNMSSLSPIAGMSFAALLDRDINGEMFDTDICIIAFHTDAEVDVRIKQFHRFGKGVTVIPLDKLS